jgi:hypothetical protein
LAAAEERYEAHIAEVNRDCVCERERGREREREREREGERERKRERETIVTPLLHSRNTSQLQGSHERKVQDLTALRAEVIVISK